MTTIEEANKNLEGFALISYEFNSDKGETVDLSRGSRDEVKPRYDLIPWEGTRREALIFSEGVAKYGLNNWRKGLVVTDVINHAIEHILRYLEGDREEDHLAKVKWAMTVVMEFEKTRPDLMKEFYKSHPITKEK